MNPQETIEYIKTLHQVDEPTIKKRVYPKPAPLSRELQLFKHNLEQEKFRPNTVIAYLTQAKQILKAIENHNIPSLNLCKKQTHIIRKATESKLIQYGILKKPVLLPHKGKKLDKTKYRRINADTYHDIITFLKSKYEYRKYLTMFLIGFHTGMRMSEILNLKKDNVDLTGVKLEIIGEFRPTLYIENSKNGKPRSVILINPFNPSAPIPEVLMEDLDIRVQYTPANRQDLVFPEIKLKSAKKFFDRLKNKMKINFSFHFLRHTWISEMVKRNSLALIQVQTGHTSVTSLKKYINLDSNDFANHVR